VNRVYASLPLSGPSASAGREVLLGAQLVLDQGGDGGVELVALDSYSPDRDARAVDNARLAVADGEAVAYLGDFHSSQVFQTAEALGAAGLLQVAPVATHVALRSPTLVRLMPNDAAGARAIAAWLREAGVRSALVVHDEGEEYGVPVGGMCRQAAEQAGLHVSLRPVWDQPPRPDDIEGYGAVVYIGVAGEQTPALFEALHALDPTLWLLGADGIAVSAFARELGSAAAGRTRLFVSQRAPLAFYGCEAMTLALDAIAAAGPEREAVVHAARATSNRNSPLGRYSIDKDGLTTLAAYGRMAVVDRQLVWDLDV